MSEQGTADAQPIVIKKYANRRLYNTATSCYVTLDHLAQMVKDDLQFVVYDAKSGDDITRSVLTQIIVEEESKGQNLLPVSFLRQLISFYGDNMQWMVPRYLEHSMATFAKNQQEMRHYMQETMSGLFPLDGIEKVGKHQIAMFERTMKMFNPFDPEGEGLVSGASDPKASHPSAEAKGGGQGDPGVSQASVDELRHMIDSLQKQIDVISKAGDGDQKKQ